MYTCSKCKSCYTVPAIVDDQVICTSCATFGDKVSGIICRGYIEAVSYNVPESLVEGVIFYSCIQISQNIQLQVYASPKQLEKTTIEDLDKRVKMSTRVYHVEKNKDPYQIHVYNSLPIYTFASSINNDSIVVQDTIEVGLIDPVYNKGQDGIRLFIFKYDNNFYAIQERNIYLLCTAANNWAHFGDTHLRYEIGHLIGQHGPHMTNGHFLHVIISPPISLRGPNVPQYKCIVVSNNFNSRLVAKRMTYNEANSYLSDAWYNTVHIRDLTTGAQYIVVRPEYEAFIGLEITPYNPINIRNMYLKSKPLDYTNEAIRFSEQAYANATIANRREHKQMRRYYLTGIQSAIPDPIKFILDSNEIDIRDNCLYIARKFDLRSMPPVYKPISARNIACIVSNSTHMRIVHDIISEYLYTMLSAIIVSYDSRKEIPNKSEQTISDTLYRICYDVIKYITYLILKIEEHGAEVFVTKVAGLGPIKKASDRAVGIDASKEDKRNALLIYIINQPPANNIHKNLRTFLSV